MTPTFDDSVTHYVMKADRHVYLTDAGILVDEGHPDANFHIVYKGRDYTSGEVADFRKRFGIEIDEKGKVSGDIQPAPKEESKKPEAKKDEPKKEEGK